MIMIMIKVNFAVFLIKKSEFWTYRLQ